jgi:hypothetical protein
MDFDLPAPLSPALRALLRQLEARACRAADEASR